MLIYDEPYLFLSKFCFIRLISNYWIIFWFALLPIWRVYFFNYFTNFIFLYLFKIQQTFQFTLLLSAHLPRHSPNNIGWLNISKKYRISKKYKAKTGKHYHSPGRSTISWYFFMLRYCTRRKQEVNCFSPLFFCYCCPFILLPSLFFSIVRMCRQKKHKEMVWELIPKFIESLFIVVCVGEYKKKQNTWYTYRRKLEDFFCQ